MIKTSSTGVKSNKGINYRKDLMCYELQVLINRVKILLLTLVNVSVRMRQKYCLFFLNGGDKKNLMKVFSH